ncbi:septum formation initiator family protein [Dysgonomonas sp. 25]|uniref:FtsB family cell division protein n=1 Tax=Dysgonomonas sp. 25 TaxID=2302933 RepID=UPI0013D5A756|nr:septum formation initiator family protein [Dysgonomonas sp. 25]NDV69775.1 hypothetical protein [Dysgonomonas sp. 25]
MKFVKAIGRYLTQYFSKLQLLAIVVLIVFAFFVSDSNIFTRLNYDIEIHDLNNQIEYYREQAEKDKERLQQLNSNKEDIEKFARENFMMKKPDEDIFIVE